MQESRKRSLESLPLSPVPGIDDASLSLEERRKRNIERNKRFMEMNFGPLPERGASTLAPHSAAPSAAVDQPTACSRPARDRAREQRRALALLCEKLPHRVEQLSRIWKYFLYSTAVARPALYLYGPAESGKLATLSAVLSAVGSVAVIVDCRLCPSFRDLLTTLWAHLQAVTGSKESAPRTSAALAQALARFRGGRLCVVLRHLDSLPHTRELGHLLELKALCALVDVCVLGRTATCATGTAPFAEQCVCVHFPTYTADQQQAQLLAAAAASSPAASTDPSPTTHGLSLLALSKAVVATAAPFTHSTREAAALLRRVLAAQRACTDAGQAFSTADARAAVLAALLTRSPSATAGAVSAEAGLPRRLQCLLLAAYLATHNPQSSDNITMLGEAVRRRRVQSLAEDGIEMHAAVFSAERLLSIYAQVYHKLRGLPLSDYADASAQSMVASLVRKGVLFTAPGAQFKLHTPRYGCRLSHKQAEAVAQAMGFPLHDYLFNSSVSKFSFR